MNSRLPIAAFFFRKRFLFFKLFDKQLCAGKSLKKIFLKIFLIKKKCIFFFKYCVTFLGEIKFFLFH